MKKETVIKTEWENVWFCNLKDLQTEPKVDGTKVTFTTPVRKNCLLFYLGNSLSCTLYICAIYILYISRYWLIKQKLSSSPLHFHPLYPLSSSLIYSFLSLLLSSPLSFFIIPSYPFSSSLLYFHSVILSHPLSSFLLHFHPFSSSLIVYHPLIHFRSSLLYSYSLSSSLIHSDPHSFSVILLQLLSTVLIQPRLSISIILSHPLSSSLLHTHSLPSCLIHSDPHFSTLILYHPLLSTLILTSPLLFSIILSHPLSSSLLHHHSLSSFVMVLV